MSISGVQAISIFDDDPLSATYGVVVQKNRIAEVGQYYTNGLSDGDDAEGREVYAGDESLIEFECYDAQGNDQLRAWAAADKPLKLVLAGLQANVLWYEPSTIKITLPKSATTGTRNRTKIRMAKKGGLHKIWSGINLLDGVVKLKGFETGWQDSNGDGLADGYESQSAVTTFVSSVQNLSGSTGTTEVRITIILPLSGVPITVSSTILSVASDGSRYKFEAMDHFLQKFAEESFPVSVGVQKATFNPPAQIYTIRLSVLRNAPTSQGSSSMSFPALRTDGSDKYIAG